MAGATDFFGLAFFDFGDELDSPLNVQKEIERFTVIDRQLYAMFNIFGNGVITGWDVTANGLQLIISNGVGIIDSFAVETEFTDSIDNIPPNSVIYVYATIDSSTVETRNATFIYSTTAIFTSALLLATVTVGPSAVISIDNDVRKKIGFKEIIDAAIASHRHNGADVPKIDLTQEVQGELPMDHIDDIDASKIVGSKLSESVIPTLDHTDLKNIGSLTHAQIDSFVQSIQKDNTVLFGEITTINLLKMICYLLYLDQEADRSYENTIAIIPGITPDDRIDFEATNANVNFDTHCISGIPATSGSLIGDGEDTSGGNVTENLQIMTIPWIEDADWKLASAISNLTISEGVKISVNTIDARIIESFDNGVIGQSIGTYVSTLEETNTTTAMYDQPAAQGPLSGTFSTTNTRKMKQVRTFPRSQDWSSYDTINVYIKSGLATHSPVMMVIKDDTGGELSTLLLLAADEVTTLTNADTNGFALKKFAISGFTRNAVLSIEFITDTISNETESYSIDTIFLTSQNFLLPQGNIKLRYNTTSSVSSSPNKSRVSSTSRMVSSSAVPSASVSNIWRTNDAASLRMHSGTSAFL
jgi:hypothetical protein